MDNPSTRVTDDPDLSLEHLRIELARIDILIQRQVRRWRLAGQDPADSFRGLYVSEAETDGLLARPLAASWGQTVALEPGEEQAFHQAETRTLQQVETVVETARNQGQTPRLLRLMEAFELDRFELDAFLICLAPTLDLRYERLYGYLQDDVTRKRPTINLILDLLGLTGSDRLLQLSHFADNAPLFRSRLLERGPESGADNQPLLSHTLNVDQAIVVWLLGRYQPHGDLGPQAKLLKPRWNEADALLAADVWPELEQALGANARPAIIFHGPDRMSQEAAARLVAARANRMLLVVNLAAVISSDVSPAAALRLALRDARLTGAIPCLLGWDACLATEENETPSPELLVELCLYPDLVIGVGEKSWQARGIDRERTLYRFEFPVPAYAHRLALWRHCLKSGRNDIEVEGDDLKALAGQFALTTGQIRDAVATARDMATQRDETVTTPDLLAAARAHSNPRLAALARKIVPRYSWLDIILPADQLALLREIVATVRGRPLVLDEWGVGRKLASSAGVTVLFAGDPGTGKTMAAEILAGELGLDLFKIDLSTVVSKYIGETEKNLERIFSEAQSSNAILFFDEADAIFGKRSEVKDAHDRYANIEISYLLQRMEAYDGVTILATNLRANLDEAFTRRLQFAVDFPFPEPEDRLRIWQTLFPPDVPRTADLDFKFLARRFKLAGGNIRNIIVSAAYLAAADGKRVTMNHLLHGTRRELQKMGRLVGEEDFQAH